LTLRTTDDGVRLFAQPVREIEQLYGRQHQIEVGRHALAENASEELVLGAETIDLHAVFEIGQAKKIGLNIGGNLVVYDVLKQQLQGARVRPQKGQVVIRVLVDRPMLEIIANRGSVSITEPRAKRGNVGKVTAFAEGGQAWLRELRAYELKSIWKR
jgi:sucrose-6-phosphate hydrolase SacC (GH32 family)